MLWAVVVAVVGVAESGSVLQLTDLHFDPEYAVQGGVPPSLGGHCRYNASFPSTGSLGQYGTYGCDSPYKLVNHSLDQMAAIIPNPDFIIWSGDSMPHIPNSFYNESDVIWQLNILTTEIEKRWPGVPLYPVWGNHDYWPSGNFPGTSSALYTQMAQRWATHIGNQTTMVNSGYYSFELPNMAVTLLGLNTNLYFYYNRLPDTTLGTDPGQQLQWIQGQCDQARERGRMVLVSAHVPPG